MGKIGIITFHRTTNFGSLLQTYGLYKKIELLGKTPEIIDYRCDEIESREELNNQFKFTVRELAKRMLFYPTIKRKAEKLNDFLEKNAQMTNPIYADNIKHLSYDKIIVGSDIGGDETLLITTIIIFLNFLMKMKKNMHLHPLLEIIVCMMMMNISVNY